MKRNFIHHLRWTKSNVLYFCFITLYFFTLVPLLVAIEIVNPGINWNDGINIAAFVFNTTMFVKNTMRMHKQWGEFYLTDIDATKNIILDKTCENCRYCIYVDTSMYINARSITANKVVTKGECRLLCNYKLRKDDLPTCKNYDEIPDFIRKNFSNI